MPQQKVTNRKRTGCLVGIFFILLFALILRLAYWMIFRAEWLQEKAQNQWTRTTTVEAERGTITDVNGTVLASSASCYSVVLLPRDLAAAQKKENSAAAKDGRAPVDLEQRLVSTLSETLGMEAEDISTKLVNKKKWEVWLKRQISDEQAAGISAALQAEDETKITGVKLVEDIRRYYPMGTFLCQTLGFVSVDGVGQQGIEARFNSYLAGTDGYTSMTADVKGRELPEGVTEEQAAVAGRTVRLTVDAAIQGTAEKTAQRCMDEQQAAAVTCVVMDVDSGRVLGTVNKPDYDSNTPPRGDGELLQKLSLNRTVGVSVQPGTVFEAFTAASALENGLNLQEMYACDGKVTLAGEHLQCWAPVAHGELNAAEAMTLGCRASYLHLAAELGTERFYSTLYDLGFGAQTGIQLTGEAAGSVRSEKYIRDTDLAEIGAGQGITATPLQLVTAISAVANGGSLMKPMIVEDIADKDGNVITFYEPTEVRRALKEETCSVLTRMLADSVENGVAMTAALKEYSVAGLAGTAQKYDENNTLLEDSRMTSFLGFAPAEDPKVAILFMVDDPQGSDYGTLSAAPYAAEVLHDTLVYLNVPMKAETPASGDTVKVPDLSGRAAENALQMLEDRGLHGVALGISGGVIAQYPAPDTEVARDSHVIIGLEYADDANDANALFMPRLTDLKPTQAYLKLREAGFKVKVVGQGDRVASQDPVEGARVFFGDTVTLTLDHTAEETTVPGAGPEE